MTELSNQQFSRRTRLSRLGVALTVVVAVGMLTAPPSLASAASSGSFDEYESGPALGFTDVSGHAQLVRTGNGRTIASVTIKGLVPDGEYAVHVHELACDALGGHYFFESPVADGDGPNDDEIWPGPVTANAAGNAQGKTVVGDTAGSEAQSVVVHATATGGPRIACADLS